jgi:hypothetical protein
LRKRINDVGNVGYYQTAELSSTVAAIKGGSSPSAFVAGNVPKSDVAQSEAANASSHGRTGEPLPPFICLVVISMISVVLWAIIIKLVFEAVR